MYLLAVDGRTENSGGMTMLALARFLQQQGAHTTLNLDGGGSTSMVARNAGESGVKVTNNPSDGAERNVPNGVGIFTAPGSGRLAGMALRAKYPAEHSDRAFPGLARTLAAIGHDESYGPAAVGSGEWWVDPPAAGLLFGGGVFVPGSHGPVRIDYTAGGIKGSTQLQILGPLQQVLTAPEAISLNNDGTATFTVSGADSDGYTAPIEPQNVTLSYDTSALAITPTETGGFRIEARGRDRMWRALSRSMWPESRRSCPSAAARPRPWRPISKA